MVDAVAMLPLAVAALATSGPILRAPLILVVFFCVGWILTLGQRVARLPLVGRSNRLRFLPTRCRQHTVLAADARRGPTALGLLDIARPRQHLLLSAIGVRFSPTLALVVLCMSAATSILPITAGGAVAGMGATAGVLLALGVSKGAAVNFALASGLLLTCAALAAAVLGLGGSLLRRSGRVVRSPPCSWSSRWTEDEFASAEYRAGDIATTRNAAVAPEQSLARTNCVERRRIIASVCARGPSEDPYWPDAKVD